MRLVSGGSVRHDARGVRHAQHVHTGRGLSVPREASFGALVSGEAGVPIFLVSVRGFAKG